MEANPNIAIVSSEVGWHTQRLVSAFSAKACDIRVFALPECEFLITDDKKSPVLPGYDGTLPDAAFVRCIPKGSFEQVTFYLSILHAMKASGVLVYNEATTIERSVDKAMATFLLAQAGLPTPKTWVGVDQARAQIIIDEYLVAGRALVMKPLFGAQGKDLQLIDEDNPAPVLPSDSTYYLQEFVSGKTDEGTWRDWRLFVAGGKVLAAMERVNNHWISNVAQGGECHVAQADAQMTQYAETAAACINAFYAGVDIIRDRDGKDWVIEVNSIPAWKGLQSVSDGDIADKLAEDLLRRL